MSRTLRCGHPSRRSVLASGNLKTANAFGLTISLSVLARADEIIQ